MLQTEAKRAAKWLRSRWGMSVFPLSKKRPTISWKKFQDRRPSLAEIEEWEWHGVAIVTGEISGVVVVDCDDMATATRFWNSGGNTKTAVATPRGRHFYFRWTEEIRNYRGDWDIRGDGGYVAAPPTPGYRWTLPLSIDLPAFNRSWRPEQSGPKMIGNGEAFISKIYARSGANGHGETYRAACSLRDAGLSESAALLAMQRWNQTNASPPWKDHELLHKVRSAYK